MASASGAFVAGNLVKSLAEKGESPPKDMQVESYWRIDPTLNHVNTGSPAMTKKDSAESLEMVPNANVRAVRATDKPGAKAVVTPEGGGGVDSVPKAVDSPEEGMEHGDTSPSRATSVAPSVAPSSSVSTRSSKFDKYYHKKLVSTLLCVFLGIYMEIQFHCQLHAARYVLMMHP